MRPLRTLVVAAVALVAVAAPAGAHVSVQPESADRGSDATFTFRVPNERDDAATVEVAIELPAEFERVEAGEAAGWTATVEDGAVRWTGGRIEGEQSQEFALTVGPLPGADELVFRAVQTYEDGEVVRWVNEAQEEQPAPVVTLTGEAPTTTTTSTTAATTSTTTAGDDAPVGATDDETDDGLPVAGLVLGLVVVVLAVASYLLARRRRPPQA